MDRNVSLLLNAYHAHREQRMTRKESLAAAVRFLEAIGMEVPKVPLAMLP